jgi:hypothetical protein
MLGCVVDAAGVVFVRRVTDVVVSMKVVCSNCTGLAQPRLGIPIFGSGFWDPHRKQNSGSVSDSEDSGRKNFNQIPLLKNQEIGIWIPKFRILKK